MEIVEFLRARLDEDQAEAQAAQDVAPGPWKWPTEDYGHIRDANGEVVVYDEGSPGDYDGPHIAKWHPARVLAEVAVKRSLLDLHQNVNDGDCGTCVVGAWGYPTNGGSRPERWPCPTVLALVQPYADSPYFDPAWKVSE